MIKKAINKRTRRGFSLLELLAVVTILGIIALIVIPRVSNSSYNAKVKANAFNKATINAAVERYYIENGSWPSANLSELVAGGSTDYFPTGTIPVSPHDGATAYTISTTTHRVDNNADPAP